MDRRTQILAVAERLLEHYGPGKTTVAEIAREAGLGVGTVYLEFHSKDDILAALSHRRHEQVLDAMRAARERPAADFAARFTAVMNAKVEALWSVTETGAHAADLVHCGQSAVQQEHQRFLQRERELLASLLSDAAAAGEFSVSDPAATASVVLTAYGAFAPPWLFRHCRDDIDRKLRAMHALVLNGLCSR